MQDVSIGMDIGGTHIRVLKNQVKTILSTKDFDDFMDLMDLQLILTEAKYFLKYILKRVEITVTKMDY